MTTLQQRLKELRLENQLTQKELADKLKVSQNAIFNWEKGNRKPSKEMIEKIAFLFHVSPAYLMGWDSGITITSKDGIKHTLDLHTFIPNDKLSLEEDRRIASDALIEQMKQEILLNTLQEFMNYPENQIVEIMKSLNREGQEKVIDYANDLAENPKYCKDTSDED